MTPGQPWVYCWYTPRPAGSHAMPHTSPASSRERLLHAAAELFLRDGFGPVGLDRIIGAVGVTKTTFYNHFESKDELVIAVPLERDRIELAEWMRITEQKGGDDPRARILALFDLLEDWLADPAFKGCMFLKAAAEYPSPRDPVHQAALVHGKNLAEALKRHAAAAGAKDPGGLAGQLMMVLAGAVLNRHETGFADRARTARATAGVLVDHHLPAQPVRG